MFTHGTQNFGAWKELRENNIRAHSIRKIQFLFSLLTLLWVLILIFVIVMKAKQEFYSIESMPFQSYQHKPEGLGGNFIFKERTSAFSIAIFPNKLKEENSLKIVFENGDSFSFPQETKKLSECIEKRKRNMMLTTMMLRTASTSIARIKIWREEGVSFQDTRRIMAFFSHFGFDNFDFAIERRALK